MSEQHHSVSEGLPDSKNRRITPWAWIPSVYFAQGLQYAIVVQLFAIVFFMMGVPKGATLFWVGLISFPWVIKPLWGPLVDKYWTKRGWTWLMQLTVAAAFVAVAFSLLIPGRMPLFGAGSQPPFFYASVFFLFILALAGATHDIACDGYYMMGLSEKQQAFYVGIRSTVFRVALIFANGVLIWFADVVQRGTGLDPVESVVQASGGENYQAPSMDAYLAEEKWSVPAEQAILIKPETLDLEAGEKGFFTVRLAKEPEKEIIVNVRLDKGDRGILLADSSQRLIFNKDNWQRGLLVETSADERITGTMTDKIEAGSGNLAVSWWAVAILCGGFFLTAGLWHRFILPYPPNDVTDASVRVPIYKAAMALLLTIGVPWLLGLTLFETMDLAKAPLHDLIIGELPADKGVAAALQTLRKSVDADKESLDPGKLLAVIHAEKRVNEEFGEEFPGKENDIARLRGLINARRLATESKIENAGDFSTRVEQLLTRKKQDADIYGNPHLVDLETRLKLIATGDMPDNGEDLNLLLVKSFSTDPGVLASKDTKELFTTLEVATKANAGKFPGTEEEFRTLYEHSKTIPSITAEKGFTFFFTAARLLILVGIVWLFIAVQPFKAGAMGFFNSLSDESGIGFAGVFGSFFNKPGMAVTLGFLLTFRLGEAQLGSVKNLFLLDDVANGGLALSLSQVAFVNSIIYLMALTVGGLLGGFMIARYGLKPIIWIMVAAMNLPNALYIWLAVAKPAYAGSVFTNPINWVVGIESFGYGFGFAAYLLVMILAAQGPHKTAHYALCTGAMALGYMIPGMWSGYLAELVNYTWFFVLVMFFTVPGMLFVPFLKIDPMFGKKEV